MSGNVFRSWIAERIPVPPGMPGKPLQDLTEYLFSLRPAGAKKKAEEW